jgi:hypothetical protein
LLPRLRDLNASHKALKDAAPEVQAHVLELACQEIHAEIARRFSSGSRHFLARELILDLVRRKVAVPPDRVVNILDLCTAVGSSYEHWIPIVSLLRLVSKPPTVREVEALHRLRSEMLDSPSRGPRKIVEAIDDILAGEERPLAPGGNWSARVLADIAKDAEVPRSAWCELVAHLLDLGDAEPSRKWEGELRRRLDHIGRAQFVERALGWIALGPMPDAPASPCMPERDADYLKGFVWAIAEFEGAAIVRALADLAEQCFRKVPEHGPISARVGNACIRVLSRLSGAEPVAQLGRLRTRVKYVVGRQLIEKALMIAAARAGVAPEELEEVAVPTFDLDASGALRRRLGDCAAEIRVSGSADVGLSWFAQDGRPLKNVPAVVRERHPDELRQIKKNVKDIASLLPAQKARLERLLESDRAIPFDLWRERYPEHPLIGQMSRRLMWQFSDGERQALGAWLDGRICDVNAEPLGRLSASTHVRLWHPLGSPPDLVAAWRHWLEHHAVVQPFKQAHREVYVVTDAERATEIYSNRFAAHILRQHRLAALCRERGWQYRLQGGWDSANTPMRRLTHWNLDVQYWVEPPNDGTGLTQSGIFEFVCTDQVRFLRDGAPLRLEDVPAMAFSEAMRDVDLFVGVCSIGNDPNWAERGLAPHIQYWHSYSFGPLSESAETRREVLASLIPKLRVADRLSLEERFLIVRGDLAVYKIHIGSGNILMEPGSQYLCIVPARGTKPVHLRDMWLPFEGDGGLAVILSKALLLAADRKITDPIILQQIRRS